MVSIILCWIIVSIFAFLFGFGVLTIIGRKMNYRIRHISSYIAAGLVVMSVYAEIFSLFYKVGAVAFLLMIPVAVFTGIWFRKDIAKAFRERKTGVVDIVLLVVGILLLSFASSRGYMAYDTALYHAQFIRWIEEYGVVKGLALLHFRFGYNSAAYPLCALFSFSWTGLYPMHCMAGYFVLLLFMPVTELKHIFTDRKIHFTDFIRIGIFYYLTLVFFEIVAPASDFFATSMVFFVAYRYAALVEEKENSPVPYALVSLLALYSVTLKFSAGFMAFLVIKPAYDLIREKKIKSVFAFLTMGLFILVPVLIRGYIISGWPMYPSTILGFLHPDWQIAADIAHRDSAEIRAWGQKLPELGNFAAPFTEWFPYWFKTESIINKGLLVLDALGILSVICVFPFTAFRKGGKIKRSYYLLLVVLTASFFLWFSAAPLIRYGYAFVILPCLAAMAFWYTQILVPSLNKKAADASERKRFVPADYAIMAVFAIVILYKGAMLAKESITYIRWPYYITAERYEEHETETYEIGGITFYKPVSGDQTGYEKFPAGPYELTGKLRGTSLKDGFTNP